MWSLRNWKTAWLLAIVLPISLLVTFRFTGTLNGPAEISQTMTAGTLFWNMSRPVGVDIITIDEWINNSYADNFISISSRIHVGEYIENKVNWPSDGNDDVMDMIIGVYANVSKGFIYSATVRISKPDAYAFLNIIDDPDWMEMDYLVKMKIQDGTPSHEALFSATSIDEPIQCALKITFFWVLLDQNNIDHLETLRLEIMYFDGVAYRKVILPTQLVTLVS
jgi:hypothetical protein